MTALEQLKIQIELIIKLSGMQRPGATLLRSALKAVEDGQRWIPVEEKLPNHGEEVLAVHENHKNLTESEFIVGRLMFFMGKEVWCTNGGVTIRVAGGYITHWRPLPEGPEEIKGKTTP